MKNSAVKEYIIRVVIYLACIALLTIMFDKVFNGFIIDMLYTLLPINIYYFIIGNRLTFIFLLYTAGLIVISALYIFKRNRLLAIASRAISEEQPEIFGEKCPTELRLFSQRLKEFKIEFRENEHARKLAEQQKNDLIVYLAHDLKTPLTSVIGYLSLLEDMQELPIEQRAKYVGIALDKAYRLEQLINEFFDITRLELQNITAQKSRVDLTVLLLQVINEFFPLLEQKRVKVIQNIDAELIISADADKLARVFDNLFRNAVSYCYEDTEIICTAKIIAGKANVSIKNIGEDIPKEKLAHIFDKFYRIDGARTSTTGGAGLGLAIAKQIVELHGGSITADCNNGITEFKVIIPM